MSDTPKADAIRHDISKYRIYRDEYDGDWYPHFCQLERKLAAVTSERDRLKDCMRKIHLAAQNSGTRVSDLEKESREALRGEVQGE
jgi:hypothetical protein